MNTKFIKAEENKTVFWSTVHANMHRLHACIILNNYEQSYKSTTLNKGSFEMTIKHGPENI